MADDARVRRLLAECREREERGETVDEAALVAAHPDIAGPLRQAFAGLAGLRSAFPAIADDETPSRAGTLLGAYRLDRLLGAGGMGEVWLAAVEGIVAGLDAGTHVAVKVIHPRLVASPELHKRFLREAEIGRRLRHPNVVRTLGAGEATVDGTAERFLVLEYVEGTTLRDVLDDLGHLPEALCRHIGREVAKALGAIHAAGAVHRDLKPENVLVTKDHVVKVTDLGVARITDDDARLSQSGLFVGSLQYGAPEQFGRGVEIDGRADLHALGVLLHELATGVHPFADEEFPVVVRRILEETPRRLGGLQPQVSPFLEELVAQLLQKDPAKRPSAADDVARILGQGEESDWWRARSVALREETRRPLRRIRIPRETALYGRDAELARLRALYEKAKAGEGQVVLVEGEAGIGKSRLVDEFAGLLHRDGEDANFLFGSYPPGGAATASGAFTTAYREHFGDDEAALRAALPVTPLLVPAFAALLKGDATPAGAEPLTKDSLQTVFVHATRALAAERTTIVLIEDLHFAPEEGRALFASLALAVPGHRVLLVGETRPGLDAKWLSRLTSRAHAVPLSIPRLGPKELVHVLRDALKSERLADELAGLVAVKSDGNPFFVFELLRGLKEGQFLAQRPDGTWHTTQRIRDIQVPSSILELVQGRVADLADDERNLLDVAACCGFEFDPLLVGRVLGVAPIPVMQAFAKIEKRHRLVRSSGRRCVFDHHQVQEALYGGLAEILREQYHAAIGDALEAGNGAASKESKDVDGALCVDLAKHFFKGDRGSQGLRYLGAALTHLEKGYSNDAAIRLAERALAVTGLVAGAERTRLLLRIATTDGPLHLLGRRDAQRRYIEEALALARASGYRQAEAKATVDLGVLFCSLGLFDEAREHDERGIALARDVGDRQCEFAGTSNVAVVFYSLGRFDEARQNWERCLTLEREIGDRRGEAGTTGNLGHILHSLGRFDEAREHYLRCLALMREVGDRLGEAMTTGNLGNVFYSLCRFDKAQELHERHLELTREIGFREGEAAALGNLGNTWLSLGHWLRSRESLLASLEICREIGKRVYESYALLGLSMVADEEGDTVRARNLTEETLALGRKIGHGAGVADSLIALGDLRRRAGDVHGARVAIEEAATLLSEQERKTELALALAVLACLPGGDVEAAETALAEAGESQYTTRTRLLLWQVTRDRAHLAEAKRLLDELLAKHPPELHAAMLTNVRVNREIAAAAREHGL